MTRPRAADDFATIRARLDELRRERAQVSAGQDGRSSTGENTGNFIDLSLDPQIWGSKRP